MVLKPVLLGVSSVCLIITWLVYVSVARLRSLNESRCLLSLVSALFVAYVTLIILNYTASDYASTFCVVAGEWRRKELMACHGTFLNEALIYPAAPINMALVWRLITV